MNTVTIVLILLGIWGLFASGGLAYTMSLLRGTTPAGPPAVSPNFGFILDALSRLIIYIPNSLVIFGFIADAILGQFHYSASGIAGILGMLLNKGSGPLFEWISHRITMLRYTPSAPAAAPATAPNPFDVPDNPFDMFGGQRGGVILCTSQEFGWLENTIAPQGIVLSMTVLFFLLTEMWDTEQASHTIALSAITVCIFVAQSITLYGNGCLTGYTYGKWAVLIGLIMGMAFGSSFYGIAKAISKAIPGSRGGVGGGGGLPNAKVNFSMNTNTNKVCPVGTHLSPEGNCVGADSEEIPVGQFQGEKSSPTDPNDQFVCEAYKDGELITSTIAS